MSEFPKEFFEFVVRCSFGSARVRSIWECKSTAGRAALVTVGWLFSYYAALLENRRWVLPLAISRLANRAGLKKI